MRVYLEGLRGHILEVGQHFDVRVLITSHLLSNYSSARRVLKEATCVVYFQKRERQLWPVLVDRPYCNLLQMNKTIYTYI